MKKKMQRLLATQNPFSRNTNYEKGTLATHVIPKRRSLNTT